jgi:toxin ParE1/3/4
MAHILSPQAEAELNEIWSYLAEESGSQDIADRFIDTLTQRFYLLALTPFIGRRRDEDLRAGMRSFPVGDFVILYRVEEVHVRILHVVRGSRNIEVLFQ